MELRVGDCVFVRGSPDDPNGDFVGCIVDLFDNVHVKETRGHVHWLYRLVDVERSAEGRGEAKKALRFTISTKRVGKKELFLGSAGDIGLIDLDCLVDKCTVQFLRRSDPDPGEDSEEFFVRQAFNNSTSEFEKLTDSLLRKACVLPDKWQNESESESDENITYRTRSAHRTKEQPTLANRKRKQSVQSKSWTNANDVAELDSDPDSDWTPAGDEDEDNRVARQQQQEKSATPRSKRSKTQVVVAKRRPRVRPAVKRKLTEHQQGSQLPVRLAPTLLPDSPLDEACSR